jgi:hypothetical protein
MSSVRPFVAPPRVVEQRLVQMEDGAPQRHDRNA